MVLGRARGMSAVEEELRRRMVSTADKDRRVGASGLPLPGDAGLRVHTEA